jgi:hypothetical protein
MKNLSVWVIGRPSGFNSRRLNPIESSGWKYSTSTALRVRSTVASARLALEARRNQPA